MKNKLLIYAYILTFFTITGCNGTKYEIYENHEISACGVNDPLNNFVWLREFCNTNRNAYNAEIQLLLDTTTNNYYFDLFVETKKPNENEFGNVLVYDCNGVEAFSWYMGTPPSPRYDAFFLNKKNLGRIWSVNQIIK
jgi:hypothetical protein